MTAPKPPAKPVPVAVKVGFLLLVAGLAAWLWLGEWRWAAMGVLALLASAVVGSSRKTDAS
jgi:hypothetical protein